MQDLRLIGIHEDGESLLVSTPDGDRLRLPVDDALRAAIRRERPLGDGSPEGSAPEPMRPREVQAMMRAGAGVEEVAERSGWTVEKVRRFEPPIRAERDFVAGRAREVDLQGTATGATTLGERVARRLRERGVDAERVAWDAWKDVDGDWVVVCIFPAGGKERQARWRFDPSGRAVTARDDEARWLSEDERAKKSSTKPTLPRRGRTAAVYDVEAEGGVSAAVRRRPKQAPAEESPPTPARSGSKPTAQQPEASTPQADHDDEGTVDLMTAMRERAANRRRRSRRPTTPTDTPVSAEDMPSTARPVERLHLADVEGPEGSRGESAPDHDPVTGTGDLFADLEQVAHGAEDDDEHDAHDDHGSADEEFTDEVDAAAEDREDSGDLDDLDDRADLEDADALDQADGELEDGDELTDDELAAVDEFEDGDEDDDLTEVDQDAAAPGSTGAHALEDDEAEAPVEEAEDEPSPRKVPTRQSSSRKGRPSVPSWDDIMFGTRGSSDD